MRHVAPLVGLVLLTAGCYSTQRSPVTRPSIQLDDPRPFAVHLGDPADMSRETCAVRRLRATVREVRGDTLLLDDASTLRRAPRTRDCLRGRAGYVVLAEQRSIETVTMHANPWRTAGAILLAIPFGVALTLLAIMGPPT
jgi:hypothetical protein